MNIRTERVEIPVADGTTMSGYLVLPEGNERRPGILILQEIFGVNDHIKSVAERYAREGYVTFAPDLFHRQVPDYIGSYDDIMASIQLAMKYGAAQSEADVRAAADYLRNHPAVNGRLGCLGFCMGGRLSFVTNGVVKLDAAISFYGNIAPDKLSYAETLSGPMMLIWAGKDAHIPRASQVETVETLRKLGKPYINVEFSEQNHGFFCDARSDYDAGAARQAWALTTAFLAENLK
ncbi:MAG: dienelactone hydrolase family protein [Polyangiaceae bacterium]|nr:dienelactone hydrolase family protein [Polyangiaceae bacterium]